MTIKNFKNFYVGLDIGASSIKGVLADGGKIVRSADLDTPRNFKELLAALGALRTELAGDIKVAGIGVAVAGVLDKERNKMLRSPNMSFLDRRDLRRAFTAALGTRRLALEHDVHALLLAEKKYGAARDKKNVFCLTLGSGIGGAFMVNGEIVYGAHGASGEVGHMIVDLMGGRDLETLAANKFIYKNLEMNFHKAFRIARLGDKKAQAVLAVLGENLGVGIANIINIFDPEMIILGGGITSARKFIAPGVKRGINKFVTSPAARRTKITYSRLGRFGGALGAALLADQI
ncbi:MAG: ROK family protein [Candidatus Niyogibacteria bacterium]|nr:ROK family protein [Candidatus Niyogibacteria bacterium]